MIAHSDSRARFLHTARVMLLYVEQRVRSMHDMSKPVYWRRSTEVLDSAGVDERIYYRFLEWSSRQQSRTVRAGQLVNSVLRGSYKTYGQSWQRDEGEHGVVQPVVF